jgi:hypothetical protein
VELALGRPNLIKEFGPNLNNVALGIQRVVVGSLRTHPMRETTVAEAKRRTQFCLDLALELRHSMKWGAQRIVDTLPYALAAHLDGKNWEPDKRAVWVAGDGN